MDYDNIFSAFLGALFGFAASIYIYRISLLDAAKMNLIAAIVRMRDFRFATTHLDAPRDDVAVFKISFADIYALFLIYRGTVMPWSRSGLDRAWEIYQGTDAKKKHGLEDMLLPANADEVQDRLAKFLRAIQ